MTTPDFPDWSLPVNVLDQSAVIGGSPNFLSNGQALTNIDCSRYNSLAVAVTFPAGTIAQHYALQIQWLESGQVVDTEYITFHPAVAYSPNITGLQWRLPVRGSSFTLTMFGSDGSTARVYVTASTRTLPSNRSTTTFFPATHRLWSINFGSLAAGATSSTCYIPPVTSHVMLQSNQKIAAMQFFVDAVTLVNNAIAVTRLANIFGTDVTLQGLALQAPYLALEIAAFNADTAAHSTTLNVWDVS